MPKDKYLTICQLNLALLQLVSSALTVHKRGIQLVPKLFDAFLLIPRREAEVGL